MYTTEEPTRRWDGGLPTKRHAVLAYSGVYCVTFISGSSKGNRNIYLLLSHLDNDATRHSHPDWIPFVVYLSASMSLAHPDKKPSLI
jgi:hypothetical protein